MKTPRSITVSGLKWAAFIAVALLFLPPLLIGFLPVWEHAKKLAQSNEQLRGVCPSHASIKLSRWFYTYKFSGESAESAFNGTVANRDCSRKFNIRFKKTDEIWAIDRITIID
ncbi:hypothetical protein [Variovorax arabinosiphilus]|uniref:hypothetical protein n=1 Tax=Variovorax arabinosiphilus TaxID=3053498 RepID=UPI00257897B4|nr:MULTISPECIES: hypothetical protein [unclassified Variovorax]MDM0122590.1 hypothetical protein [Variovorax sp. J2L1-78]MDM0130881.1 hypothetical protein [Variovorax sp. J2L1-63]MDM0235353.1 hypothetical protein [Variovorax sp. J2R1-6]